MPDREKVIKGLEEISDYFFNVYHHSKGREEINEAKDRCDAVEDALILLKEQEPLPMFEGKANKCTCGHEINRYWNPKFCGFCGKELMWY